MVRGLRSWKLKSIGEMGAKAEAGCDLWGFLLNITKGDVLLPGSSELRSIAASPRKGSRTLEEGSLFASGKRIHALNINPQSIPSN
jgi:hypothetical protein